jgi:hypothetical protein
MSNLQTQPGKASKEIRTDGIAKRLTREKEYNSIVGADPPDFFSGWLSDSQ